MNLFSTRQSEIETSIREIHFVHMPRIEDSPSILLQVSQEVKRCFEKIQVLTSNNRKIETPRMLTLSKS